MRPRCTRVTLRARGSYRALRARVAFGARWTLGAGSTGLAFRAGQPGRTLRPRCPHLTLSPGWALRAWCAGGTLSPSGTPRARWSLCTA